MGGPKACYARGGPGREDGLAQAQGDRGAGADRATSRRRSPTRATTATIAQKLLETSVVKHALKTTGTPFLYQSEPAARRDGHEEQPGDHLDRQARRRAHHPVSSGDGGLLPLPGQLPSAERPEDRCERQLRPRRRTRVRHARQVRPERRHRPDRERHPAEQHLQRSRASTRRPPARPSRGRWSSISAASSRASTPAASN